MFNQNLWQSPVEFVLYCALHKTQFTHFRLVVYYPSFGERISTNYKRIVTKIMQVGIGTVL